MSTLTRREAALPKARKTGEPPSLSFAWERFSDIAGELAPLWKLHWSEIALDRDIVPLDPNWDFYEFLDRGGALAILTARSRKGKLAGYIFNRLGPHDHYVSTIFAHTEMFWLHPFFRKGWQPVKMFQANLRGLKERSVVVASISFKLHFKDGRVGQLLARLGYEPADIVLRKRL